MALYTVIYNWYLSLFGTELNNFESTIMGQTINLKEWLCHSGTIITLIAMCIFLYIAIKYMFKLFACLWVR